MPAFAMPACVGCRTCEMACCPSRIFVLRIPVDLSHDLQQASRLRYIDISIFG